MSNICRVLGKLNFNKVGVVILKYAINNYNYKSKTTNLSLETEH